MGQVQASKVCSHCDERVLAVKPTPHHLLHLLLTFVTFGIWGIFWLAASLSSAGFYRCTRCGTEI